MPRDLRLVMILLRPCNRFGKSTQSERQDAHMFGLYQDIVVCLWGLRLSAKVH